MMAKRKQSVEWIKSSLCNVRLCLEKLHEERRRLTETIERLEQQRDYEQAQIERAEAEGVTEFDPKTFKPKKKGEAN